MADYDWMMNAHAEFLKLLVGTILQGTFFFCEIVFSQNYVKAELLILYTRDTAQAVFLLLLIQQERQAKWLS